MPKIIKIPRLKKFQGNREAWLSEISQRMKMEVFDAYEMKEFGVSCGFPSRFALGIKKRVIGECHASESSVAGRHEIFISPLLAGSLAAAGTLAHEMAHVAAGIEAQHKGQFIKVCKYVGLTHGKPTSAGPGERLEKRLLEYIEDIGDYPHVPFNPAKVLKPKNPRLVKVICQCGCNFQMSKKWLGEAGLPQCGCGQLMYVK